MNEKFEDPDVPEVPMASKPETPVFKEVHEKGPLGEVAEEQIEKTRQSILEKYGIPTDNVLIEAADEIKTRRIRAFLILRNKESREGWYAEGHTQHVVLLAKLIEKFGGKYGISHLGDILNEEGLKLRHPWETLKGFIDPYQDGFKSFPKSREALLEELRENEAINGITAEEMKQIENGEKPIPNWFLTGLDSS